MTRTPRSPRNEHAPAAGVYLAALVGALGWSKLRRFGVRYPERSQRHVDERVFADVEVDGEVVRVELSLPDDLYRHTTARTVALDVSARGSARAKRIPLDRLAARKPALDVADVLAVARESAEVRAAEDDASRRRDARTAEVRAVLGDLGVALPDDGLPYQLGLEGAGGVERRATSHDDGDDRVVAIELVARGIDPIRRLLGVLRDAGLLRPRQTDDAQEDA